MNTSTAGRHAVSVSHSQLVSSVSAVWHPAVESGLGDASPVEGGAGQDEPEAFLDARGGAARGSDTGLPTGPDETDRQRCARAAGPW